MAAFPPRAKSCPASMMDHGQTNEAAIIHTIFSGHAALGCEDNPRMASSGIVQCMSKLHGSKVYSDPSMWKLLLRIFGRIHDDSTSRWLVHFDVSTDDQCVGVLMTWTGERWLVDSYANYMVRFASYTSSYDWVQDDADLALALEESAIVKLTPSELLDVTQKLQNGSSTPLVTLGTVGIPPAWFA